MKHPAVERAIQIAGSQKSLAVAIGRPQSLISSWLNCKKKVSAKSVPEIVDLTNGEVLAHELRPDLPRVFPAPKD
ncbi:transcriptional regulator [Yersinia pekkanenii]|uniref:Phage transcriptional regulator n=1 Tax=Yersinia pekkanenii TaxID=1288385 RepID=A0A0T9RS45_9GAMM|nr:YdaS family helix-turn-helix protein [Yersinia pekkanenii]CNI78513.1 phage transcriptional regulator [Yersinia pekkanenii]CRY69598.1 phage transcriptional regulator [Yersinia pekkanenii]